MRGQDLSSADLIDKCRNKDADYRYHESQGRQIKYVKQSKKKHDGRLQGIHEHI